MLIIPLGIAILSNDCDESEHLKIQTAEISLVEGVFNTDTIHSRTTIANVNVEVHFVVHEEYETDLEYFN